MAFLPRISIQQMQNNRLKEMLDNLLVGDPVPIHEINEFSLIIVFQHSCDVGESRRHSAKLIVRTIAEIRPFHSSSALFPWRFLLSVPPQSHAIAHIEKKERKKNSPKPVKSPVCFTPFDMYFLVPELGKQ